MRKVVIAGMLGNALEWYDYALYAFTTLIISKLFFPAGNETAHLLATLGIFAVGFVARPFGGIFFGVIGDTFGRRKALVLSIFMMAIPTGCIGLLPTYEQIGMLAPLLLTVIRVLQGLSLGGAFSGSMTFLVEHAPPGKRGLVGSASVASLVLGFMIGSLVCLGVQAPLSAEQYESWGWRIPFILGIAISLIGFYIREHCEESPTYEAAKAEGLLSKTPVRDTLRTELGHMVQAIGIYMSVTMPFYLVATYFITFTEHTLGRSHSEALVLNFMNMSILLVLASLSGWMSDRVGRRPLLAITAVLYLLAVYPVFYLLQQPDMGSILLGQALMSIVVGFYIGPVPALLVEIFPTRVRYTGMSLSYNIAAAAFGGTAPMACQWLITRTGNIYSIAYYVMLCAVVSLVSLYFYRDRHKEPLA
ncbi:MAG: MFS transporter [Proteobacteria bacterium]|nr:MFS transporter [Pseudomonadota bacterium]